MTTNILARAVLAALAILALVACDRETQQQVQREASDAGRKVERALERTGDKIADATRKATAEVKQAGSEAKAEAKSTDTKRSLSPPPSSVLNISDSAVASHVSSALPERLWNPRTAMDLRT